MSSLLIGQFHELCTWVFMQGVKVGGMKFMFYIGVKIEVEMNNPWRRKPSRKYGLQTVKKINKIQQWNL